jgi:arsenate reductase (glutaredoxin)
VSAVTIYTLRQCSTCKEATAWLRARGIDFIERPIRETPPSLAELRVMLQAQDGKIGRLINSSGLEYRALGLAAKLPALTEEEVLRLLAGNGSLVKRPFLLGPGQVGLVGFKAPVWAAALGQT